MTQAITTNGATIPNRLLAEARVAEQRASRDYSEAFRRYVLLREAPSRELLMPTPQSVPDAELRAQGVSDLALGGLWVPTAFEDRFIGRIEDLSPVLSLATVIRTPTGGDMAIPISDDASEASILAEGGQSPEADIGAGALSIPVFSIVSPTLRMSWQFLMDGGDQAMDFLVDRLAATIARRLNRALTDGSLATEPEGLVRGAGLGVTSVATGAPSSDELLDLQDALDESIRFEPSAQYMMRSATFSVCRKLKTGDGAFAAWQPDPRGESPGVLHGRRVVINKDMPALGAGQRAVVYGDFSKLLVRVTSEVMVKRLDQVYARSAQSGFVASARVGAKLLLTPSVAAFVALQQAA